MFLYMNKIYQKAYAKVNIGLDVLRRRTDGYHEVRMIMQTVDIFDELIIEKREQAGIELQTDNSKLPLDGNNLVCKAAELLFRYTGTPPFSYSLSAQIHLLPGTAIPTGRPIRNLSGFKLHFVYNDCI